MDTRPQLDITTHCACGAVTVRVNGPVLSMLLCSCLDCQRASGTGHSTVAIVKATSLSVSGPTTAFDRPSASGATFTRHFCPNCGTPLFGQSSRAEALRMLPVGLFGAATTWFSPNQLIFERSHHEWDVIAEGLPRHQTYKSTDLS